MVSGALDLLEEMLDHPIELSPHQTAIVEEFLGGEIASPPTVPAVPTIYREKLPAERQAMTHRFQVGDQEAYLTVGLYEDGRPGELFLNCSKEGSTVRGLLDAIGILTSLSLQYHVPLDALVKKFRGSQFEPSGLTSNKAIPTASSILDYVFRWLQLKFSRTHQVQEEAHERRNGNHCPECGAPVIYQEGCQVCERGCGWTRC